MAIVLKLALAACLFWLAWVYRRLRHLREQARDLGETAERLSARLRVLGRDSAEAERQDDRRLDLTDLSPAIMLCLSPEGEIRYANRSAAALFGLGQAVGQQFAPPADPRFADLPARLRPQLRQPPHEIDYEQRLLTGQGWRWIAWHERARLNSGGEVEEIRITGHDVTAYKLVEEQLTGARDEAQAATAAKSRFLAAMSHEIRTPLNGIIGMARLLQEGARSSEQRRYARAVRQSGQALLAVINDILDFSKMEAGRLTLHPRDFRLTEPVEQACQLLATAAREKGIEICVDLAENVPDRLHGDPDRLRQILFNLMGNAVKFTDDGGVMLEISTVSRDDDRTLLLFDVRDTGVGIPPEEQARLFEAFRQADNGSARRQHEGTGLGLAIAEHLVGLMHGEIGVESAPGEGSSFWFIVEFKSLPDEAAAASRLEDLPVLVIAASPLTRDAARRALTRAGADVAVAADIDDGARQIAERPASAPYAAVLVDLDLPDARDPQIRRLLYLDDRPTAMLALRWPGDGAPAETLREHGYAGAVDKPLLPWRLVATLTGMEDDDEPAPAAAAGPAPVPATGLHVLLAEDNQINQLLALTLIRKLGATADCVGDGVAAVEATRRTLYDMVLMDVQMPQMDGLEATREIRRMSGPNGRVPVIALTAGDADEDRQKCRDAGMDDYLAKPLDEEELAGALARWRVDKAATGRTQAG